jgi:hypothetical protein
MLRSLAITQGVQYHTPMIKACRILHTVLTIATATTIGTCVAVLGCSLAQPISPVAQAPASQVNTATASPATSVIVQPPTSQPGWIR